MSRQPHVGPPKQVWRWHGVAAILYILQAIFLTWPLARHLGDAIPGEGAGDNVTFVWNFWWMRHALSRGTSFFHTDYLFYPFGVDLVLHTHTALNAFVGATLLGSLSVTAAQNVVLIAACALNGLGAYALAWTVTGRVSGAVAAGTMFMAAPFFAAHLHGHFNLVAGWIIPVYAATLLAALDRGSRRMAVVAGAVLAAAVYSDYYYVVYLAALTVLVGLSRWTDIRVVREPASRPFSGLDWSLAIAAAVVIAIGVVIGVTGGGFIYVGDVGISMTSSYNLRVGFWILVLTLLWRRRRPRIRIGHAAEAPRRADAAVLATIAIVATVGASPVLWRAVELWRIGNYVSHSYSWRSMPAGVDLLALFAGNPFHPIWGRIVRQAYTAWHSDPIESTAWLGIGSLITLGMAWRLWRADRDIRFWSVVAGVFLLWALGPSLIVGGFQTGLWLPEVLVRFVPIVDNARIPGRAMVLVYLALAILSALSISALPRGRARRLAWIFCGVTLVDFAAIPFPLFRPTIPAIYQVIANGPPGAVLELPLGIRDGFGKVGTLDEQVLFFQTAHQRPIAGGFVARLPPSVKERYESSLVLGALLRMSAGELVDRPPSRETVSDFLQVSGIRYVVVDARIAPADLQTFVVRGMPLRLVDVAGDRWLYVVGPPDPPL